MMSVAAFAVSWLAASVALLAALVANRARQTAQEAARRASEARQLAQLTQVGHTPLNRWHHPGRRNIRD